VGSFRVLRLQDRSDEPYVYVIAVCPRGPWLDFVEVYYPTLEAEARHSAAVRAILSLEAA
jgi:hypothetical protein